MKALTCEMCGSTNLVKNDGVFVCQSCGTKYSVEEARKMMVEGTVNVAGTVKIDKSTELLNLYEVARRAKDTDNNEQAEKYYDKILAMEPNSWEANFYTVYYKAMSCKIAEIAYAGGRVANCIPTVVDLVKNYVPEDEQSSVVTEMFTKVTYIAAMLAGAAESHYMDISADIRADYTQDFINGVAAAADIVYTFADSVDEVWGKDMHAFTTTAWEAGIDYQNKYLVYLADKPSNIKRMESYADKIKKYQPKYTLPSLNQGGCYVATAVYGSYDCPEVWTLRRFRDYTLAESWYGRIFIRTYYAISPTLVKWFGDKSWFKNTCKVRLDKLVNRLQGNGVASSPYNDKIW